MGDGHDALLAQVIIGQAPVPLELLALVAEADGAVNVVRWRTAADDGTDYFVVERAADPGRGEFLEVAEVGAVGEVGPNDHAATDALPPDGTAYYRLRVHDVDGAVDYTELVQVTRDLPDAADMPLGFGLYPNPNTGTELHVVPRGLDPGRPYRIEVHDVDGRLVHAQSSAGAGAQTVQMPGRLAPGSYSVTLAQGDRRESKLLIVRGAGA